MEELHVIAGRCTATFEGSRDQTQYGDVVVIIKPDRTVLVHDADGYQPVAWLTRPDSLSMTGATISARDGEQQLTIRVEDEHARLALPASEAGNPRSPCPACETPLVHGNGRIHCPDCSTDYGLPAGATLLEKRCESCGLPKLRVERGCSFVICLDRRCDSLEARVRQAFDREWDCPACGEDLRVLRRGGLILGCEGYPDCETSFSFPTGIHDGSCVCGLPRFETQHGSRCLDSSCDRTAIPADVN